jgi:(p)ppGpp synthase/HD superfamily hydrolase
MPASVKNPFSFDIEKERLEKALSMKKAFDAKPLDSCLRSFAPADRAEVMAALTWLSSMELNKREANYLPHPVRVACYYVRFSERPSKDGAVLSLIHNILEVSDVKAEEIEKKFGVFVRRGCEALVVDRERQKNDRSYISEYYSMLRSQDGVVQQVKILDKLDNLLVLFLNPSDRVRKDYLIEIETHLFPMVQSQYPDFLQTFKTLALQSGSMSHQTLDQYIEKAH